MAAAHLRGYFLGYLRHLLEKVTKHFKMLNVKDSITIFSPFLRKCYYWSFGYNVFVRKNNACTLQGMASSLLILIWPLGTLSCASCLWCRNLTYAGCHRSPAIRANSRVIVSWPDQRVLDFQSQNFPYPRSYFSVAHTPAPSGLSPGFLPLGSMDCMANSNLFISPAAKGHDNVSSFGKHRCLACE